MNHRWLEILSMPTCFNHEKGVAHESVLRSYQILQHVREMLRRGDSVATISDFIQFVSEGGNDGAWEAPERARTDPDDVPF